MRAAPAWSLIRKTSLQDRTDNPLRSSNGLTKHFRAGHLAVSNTIMPGVRTGRGLVHVVTGKPMTSYDHDRYSERSSLHDVRQHAPPQFSRAFSSREPIMRTDTNFISSDDLENPDWWSQTGSNRRPPACKAGALPAELWPRKSSSPPSLGSGGQPSFRLACQPKLRSSEGWWAWEDLNFRPHAYQARALTN